MVILIVLAGLHQGIATSMAAHTVQNAWMFPRFLGGVESATFACGSRFSLFDKAEILGINKYGDSKMKAVSCLIVIICSSATMALLFLWGGLFNVSAREPHWSATTRLMGAVRDRSVAVHSNNISLDQIDNSKYLSDGLEHFHDMCRLCHGAPGYSQSEFAKGLYPNPPELASKPVQNRSDVEIYWIIDNGIKMTGMPAFGETHNKEAILGMMAVLRRLPSLSTDEYHTMLATAGIVKTTQDNPRGGTGGDESRSPLIDQKEHHH